MDLQSTKRLPNDPPETPEPATKKLKADSRRQSLGRAKQWSEGRKRKKVGGAAVLDEKNSSPPSTPTTKKPKVGQKTSTASAQKKSERKSISRARVGAANLPPVELGNMSKPDPSVHSEDGYQSDASKARAERASRRRLDRPAESITTIEEQAEPTCVHEQVDTELNPDGHEPSAQVKNEEISLEDTTSEVNCEDIEVKHEDGTESEANTVENIAESVRVEEVASKAVDSDGVDLNFGKTQLAVFVHALLFQWTISFAVVLVFFLEFLCNDETCEGNTNVVEWARQRAMCAALGFWLATIAGSSLVFGTESKIGWLLTTLSLAMASFTAKHSLELPSSLASFNILEIEGVPVKVTDLLVVLSSIAALLVFFQKAKSISCEVVESKDNEVKQGEEIATVQPASDEIANTGNIEQKPDDVMKKEEVLAYDDIKKKGGGFTFVGERVAVEHEGNQFLGIVLPVQPRTPRLVDSL